MRDASSAVSEGARRLDRDAALVTSAHQVERLPGYLRSAWGTIARRPGRESSSPASKMRGARAPPDRASRNARHETSRQPARVAFLLERLRILVKRAGSSYEPHPGVGRPLFEASMRARRSGLAKAAHRRVFVVANAAFAKRIERAAVCRRSDIARYARALCRSAEPVSLAVVTRSDRARDGGADDPEGSASASARSPSTSIGSEDERAGIRVSMLQRRDESSRGSSFDACPEIDMRRWRRVVTFGRRGRLAVMAAR